MSYDLTTEQTKRVESAINDLAITYISISPILRNMNMKPSFRIETACVDEYGRGLFNPKFVEGLNLYQLNFIIMHEAFHVLLNHTDRYKALEADKSRANNDMYTFNIAADAYINNNLINSNRFEKVDGVVDYELIKKETRLKYDEFIGMNVEELYDLLLDNKQGDSGNGSDGMPNSEDGEGEDNPLNGDMLKGDEIESEFSSGDRKKLGAGNIRRRKDNEVIDFVLDSPNINWKEILDRFIYDTSGRGDSRRTWRRQNKYYRDIYPHSKGKMKNKTRTILISIDVSGSMDENSLSRAVSVVDSLSSKYSVKLNYVLFDNRTTVKKPFTNIEDLKQDIMRNGGGGTSFSAAMCNFKIEDNSLIVITDMGFCNNAEYNIEMMDRLLKADCMFIDILETINDSNIHSFYSPYKKLLKGRYIKVG